MAPYLLETGTRKLLLLFDVQLEVHTAPACHDISKTSNALLMINVLHNGSEECHGHARMMDMKGFDISHLRISMKSNEWGNVLKLDIGKANIYMTF